MLIKEILFYLVFVAPINSQTNIDQCKINADLCTYTIREGFETLEACQVKEDPAKHLFCWRKNYD